jgi:hypothetical protein
MLVMLSIPLIAVINKRKLASHSQTFTVIVLRVWFRLSRRVLYEVWVCYSSVPGGSPPRRPIGSCLIWPWYASVSCECVREKSRRDCFGLCGWCVYLVSTSGISFAAFADLKSSLVEADLIICNKKYEAYSAVAPNDGPVYPVFKS